MWIVRLALRRPLSSGSYGAADAGSRRALVRDDERRYLSGDQFADLIAVNVGEGIEDGDPVQPVMFSSATAH